MFIEKHVMVLVGCYVSELYAHLCPYSIVWFICKNYMYDVYQIVYILVSSELYVSITLPSFVALHLPVSEIANEFPEGAY